MGDRQKECVECGGELEVGFIPEISMATAFKTSWHRDDGSDKTLLDHIKFGSGVKYERSQLIPIRALRCAQCGLLKFYANVENE